MRYYNNFFNSSALRGLSLLIILTLSVSCSKNQIFRETNREFPMNRWVKNDDQVFKPKIVNTALNYNVKLTFGHVYGFQFQKVPIQIIMESPSGEIEMLDMNLVILDENEDDIGDCLGDICDLEMPIKENYAFSEPGEYTITVKNKFNNTFLPNVLAVGLLVEKVE